jgi:hypothetical protein
MGTLLYALPTSGMGAMFSAQNKSRDFRLSWVGHAWQMSKADVACKIMRKINEVLEIY